MNFKNWLEGKESIPTQWRKRYDKHKSINPNYSYDFSPDEYKKHLSQGRKRAIDLHKKRKGPITVYHSLVTYRSNYEIVERIKSLIKLSNSPRNNEELSISIFHGPWQNAVVLEGKATLLAYWRNDVNTESDPFYKVPKTLYNQQELIASRFWDEGLIPGNKVKWHTVWYNVKKLRQSTALHDEYFQAFLNEFKKETQNLGLELKEIKGTTDSLPDRQYKKSEKHKQLVKKIENIRDAASTLSIQSSIEKGDYSNENWFKEIWQHKLNDAYKMNESQLTKIIKHTLPILKNVWIKQRANKLFTLILHNHNMDKVIFTSQQLLSLLNVVPDYFTKGIEEEKELYRKIFDKDFHFNFNEIIKQVIENNPDSNNVNQLVDKQLFELLVAN